MRYLEGCKALFGRQAKAKEGYWGMGCLGFVAKKPRTARMDEWAQEDSAAILPEGRIINAKVGRNVYTANGHRGGHA